MVKRNYLLFLNGGNINFSNQGIFDGYNNLPDDSKEIISQLYGMITNSNLLEYTNLYKKGYEKGKNKLQEETISKNKNLVKK